MMELGLYTDSLAHLDRPAVLDIAVRIGATAIEIATGGQSSAPHLDRADLLGSAAARSRLLGELASRGLHLAALNCSAWLLHPRTGDRQRTIVEETFRLAGLLGVDTVVTMSGCPGDGPAASTVNWPTYPWPDELVALRRRQWDDVVRLWSDLVEVASDTGVRIALELHPLQAVFNVPTLLELRAAVGDTVGANLDPSHLFWQQMDPLVCVRELGDAIFHVHAKDTWVDPQNVRRNGVLDTQAYTDEVNRSWIFRTVGYGHGPEFWRAFVSELRLAGYDGAISIEHEDSLMSVNEGFTKAVRFLKDTVITEKPGEAWWT
jgi:sugar phosphate isomerase/epimerase